MCRAAACRTVFTSAIEAKEWLQDPARDVTLASVTFQNYFRLLRQVAGMTGTAVTGPRELHVGSTGFGVVEVAHQRAGSAHRRR